MFEERLPKEHPNRGWNRASIIFWSRKPYRPRIRPKDLPMPRGIGSLRLLAFCVVAGLATTAVFVWTPLFFVDLFVPVNGVVYKVVLGSAAVGLTSLFYFWGTRVTRRDRELASRL